jgi:hypothetical protein
MNGLRFSIFVVLLLNFYNSNANTVNQNKIINEVSTSDAKVLQQKQSLYSDSLIKSKEVLVFSFSSTIDAEKALKIDNFILRRKGITSSLTNVNSKTITITFESGMNVKNEINDFFEIVEHHFALKM